MSDRRIRTIADLVEAVTLIDTQAIAYQARKMDGIRVWALACLGVDYEVGDRVVVTRALFTDPSDGRHPYREAATEGAYAVVRGIDFNTHHSCWQADIELEREWSVSTSPFSGEVTRYWHGRATDTPDGYQAPSAYDQKEHPDGRRHIFMVLVKHLRKATAAPVADTGDVYVGVKPGAVVVSKAVGDGISVDYDADGDPVGVEILGALRVTVDGDPVGSVASPETGDPR